MVLKLDAAAMFDVAAAPKDATSAVVAAATPLVGSVGITLPRSLGGAAGLFKSVDVGAAGMLSFEDVGTANVGAAGLVSSVEVGAAAEGVTSVVVSALENPVSSVVEGDELPPAAVPAAGGRIVLSPLDKTDVRAMGIVLAAGVDAGGIVSSVDVGAAAGGRIVEVSPWGWTVVGAAFPADEEAMMICVVVSPSGEIAVIVEEAAAP